MLLHGHFVALLIPNFSSGNVCFVPQEHDLHVRIGLLSHVLQPIAHVLETTSFGHVINQDYTVHLAIVTE